jgi:TolB-like protein/class 3 adenylate cyclase/Flp pilus assembly protein TadD
LATGSLTFLFTDIEGSTRLWEAHPEGTRRAVARHDALLRQCITAYGGHVFKTGGDAFCAAFASAPDAIAAVLSAQQALHTEPWPEGLTIRVRMALHTGAAELRDGDYFGPPLNYVARLLAVGHGGQTLVSAITRELCRNRLPAGATLKPLGEPDLKDVARREAVYQLCHADLSGTFPPLRTSSAPAAAGTSPSIAVLPFVNLSHEKENEFFADGLAEELLNVLSKIRGLRVASRMSAFSFKGSQVDISTVAQKLRVTAVLEGSVRKVGKRVRISAQLIEVATDSHLWSGSYDRELDDIFAVQDDIAQSVVKELRSALLGAKQGATASAALQEEVRVAAKGRGENAEAYRLYLQGRFFEDRQTREDIERAIGYYRQALEIDPHYALAWAGISRSYAYQAGFSWDRGIVEGYEKARETAAKAVALAPDLAEAQLALGWVCLYYDWDWEAADALFRRALDLSPGNAPAMRDRAIVAGSLGRLDEAVALLRRAATLDPLSVSIERTIARFCLSLNRVDESESAARRLHEINPRGGNTNPLGCVRLQQGRLDEALELFQNEAEHVFRLVGLTAVYHALGQAEKSDAALQELIMRDAAGAAYQIAQGYAYQGKEDLAFEWLERAYVQRDPGLISMKIDPWMRNLHQDPRWRPFFEKMNFAD